jgi:hypothetical protein
MVVRWFEFAVHLGGMLAEESRRKPGWWVSKNASQSKAQSPVTDARLLTPDASPGELPANCRAHEGLNCGQAAAKLQRTQQIPCGWNFSQGQR